jgi:hypothetical protein
VPGKGCALDSYRKFRDPGKDGQLAQFGPVPVRRRLARHQLVELVEESCRFRPGLTLHALRHKLAFKLNISIEVRRLAVKIAIAAADHMGFSDGLVDEGTKEFLLGRAEKSDRVRLDFAQHEELEKLRPPLSHSVFVKGNSQTRTSYAIVQFYGLLQLYVLLNRGGFAGSDFAIMAFLDIAKGYTESFEQTELFRFPEAPVTQGYWEVHRLKFEWMKKFNKEAQAVLEDDAKLFF